LQIPQDFLENYFAIIGTRQLHNTISIMTLGWWQMALGRRS